MIRQELEALIKKASDRMRADDNTKLVTKYIEHLSWLLFLKVHEALEDEQEILDSSYRRIITDDYKWSQWTRRDWRAEELITFINSDLFPHLRALDTSAAGRLISTLFSGVTTVMKSGYGLKEVIGIVDDIDFHSPEDVHALSVIYESLLARLGNEAGWSGEHYTPRPIVRLMVSVANPVLGETVYDPAAGSAGFLVEAFEHVRAQERTLEDHRRLQQGTFYGQESGELPYLLGSMNMVLHGVESPNIVRWNTLERDVRRVPPNEQHDVVLTNPPFGGKENPQIQQNFPIRTSATEVLFLQHVIASLKPSGRCGIVVPDGVLFDDDAAFRAVRRRLVQECNLHTIVRLPPGSFLYTPHQRLNLLFFDRAGPTEEIWFYEHPVPEARRHLKHPRYTKTQPLRFEEFEPLLEWWDNRTPTEWAWKVRVTELDEDRLDLDLRHPARQIGEEAPTLEALRVELSDAKEAIEAYVASLSDLGALAWVAEDLPPIVSLQDAGVQFNTENHDPRREPNTPFLYIDLASVDRGVVNLNHPILGKDAPSRARRVVRDKDVLFATVRPYLRGHAVVPVELDGAIASTGFAVLRPPETVDAQYLLLAMMSPAVINQCMEAMKGAHYPALKIDTVRALRIPLPTSLAEQQEIVTAMWPQLLALRNARIALGQQLLDLTDSLKDSEFNLLGDRSK